MSFPDLLLIIFLCILATAALASEAPWIPMRKRDVKRFIKLAEIKPGQIMYDLGCGDARLVCAAAEAGANAKGVELSLIPFVLANIKKAFSTKRSMITILYQSLWKTNLRDADLIYVWLTPESLPGLKEKFERELKKGAKVVTYVWRIEGWDPVHIDKRANEHKLFLYQR